MDQLRQAEAKILKLKMKAAKKKPVVEKKKYYSSESESDSEEVVEVKKREKKKKEVRIKEEVAAPVEQTRALTFSEQYPGMF
jgi:hypothetical protein